MNQALNLDLKSGTPLSKSQEGLSVEIWKSISDDPRVQPCPTSSAASVLVLLLLTVLLALD